MSIEPSSTSPVLVLHKTVLAYINSMEKCYKPSSGPMQSLTLDILLLTNGTNGPIRNGISANPYHRVFSQRQNSFAAGRLTNFCWKAAIVCFRQKNDLDS